MVSIILPTYNGARFLRESVRSILEQTYGNWELIIIDDSSTDETPEIIAGSVRLDSRIRTHRNQVNLRLPGALNVGMGLARGEFLTWTSDDNRYRPEALEVMASFLRDNAGVDVVYTGYSFMDDTGKITGYNSPAPPSDLPYSNVVGPSFLYRSAVAKRIGGYDESLVLVEDYDFWLRAFRLFQFKALRSDLYVYRIHSQSLSRKNDERIRLAIRKLLERYLYEQNLPKRSRALINFRLAREGSALRQGDYARSCLFKALYGYPLSLFSPKAWLAIFSCLLGHRTLERLKAALGKGHFMDRNRGTDHIA